MAMHYYDATGVLVLDKVTPIIKALFGHLHLNPSDARSGEIALARSSRHGRVDWRDIAKNLSEVASLLSVHVPQGREDNIHFVLRLLLSRFQAEMEEIFDLIEPADDVGVDVLFALATNLDDGHGLKQLRLEGAWYCSEPLLFEFGGNGAYFSPQVIQMSNSSQAIRLGTDLDNALSQGDLDHAARRLAQEVAQLLAGISDSADRAQVRQQLARLLADEFDYAAPRLPAGRSH
jgi:hypothetical protein